jgi:pimeloyl-ACP methyl ester carboxylesterase
VRTIEVNGVDLAVEDIGDGYPVVLVHGFPELAYSWRNQIPALADAGFRALGYDLRGSGASGGPADVDGYRLTEHVADAVGILDRLGLDRAAIVGHDWGSIIAYTAALAHPDRFTHVVSLNVPYLGIPSGFPASSVIADRFADRLGYVLRFQDPGVEDERFAANPRAWLQQTYEFVAGRPNFLTHAELDVFAERLGSSGLTGQLSLYRNIDRNLADTADLAGKKLTQPTLMVTTDRDPILPASMAEGMAPLADDLEFAHIENCGHWTQQERPDEVNTILLDWLERRVPS